MAGIPEEPIDFTKTHGIASEQPLPVPVQRDDAFNAILRMSGGVVKTRGQAMQLAGMILVAVVLVGLYIASAAPPRPPENGPVPAGQLIPA